MRQDVASTQDDARADKWCDITKKEGARALSESLDSLSRVRARIAEFFLSRARYRGAAGMAQDAGTQLCCGSSRRWILTCT